MINIVGVRFKKAGKIYYFDPLDMDLVMDDAVIVETARGIELGVVSMDRRTITDKEIVAPLKPVLRKATNEDLEKHRRNLAREKEAMSLCREKMAAHGMDMKLVDVEFTFDGNKVIFYFTADGRVDFRDLVKDLASVFRTRIELRQIGVRDEAKMKSGIGPCGRTLCCSSFLADFTSVSIKMAKEQNLSLNPTKISGICGRLMCCLKYEQDTYEDIRKRLPRYGSIVNTPMGRGEVIANNTIKEQIRVKIYGDGDDVIEYFNIADCEMIKGSYEDNGGAKREKVEGEGGSQPREGQAKSRSRNDRRGRDKDKDQDQAKDPAKAGNQDRARDKGKTRETSGDSTPEPRTEPALTAEQDPSGPPHSQSDGAEPIGPRVNETAELNPEPELIVPTEADPSPVAGTPPITVTPEQPFSSQSEPE